MEIEVEFPFLDREASVLAHVGRNRGEINALKL